jgi:hypothetical protein
MSGENQNSVDLSDENLGLAVKELLDDKNSMNWVVFGFNDTTFTKLEVIQVGENGFTELKKKMKMDWAPRILFGAFIVSALDHRGATVTSRRSKLVAFSFVGTAVPEYQRAQTSFLKSQIIQKLFRSPHLTMEMAGRDLDALFTEKAVALKLNDATAAHKPTHYAFGGGGKEISVDELKGQKEESDDEFED